MQRFYRRKHRHKTPLEREWSRKNLEGTLSHAGDHEGFNAIVIVLPTAFDESVVETQKRDAEG